MDKDLKSKAVKELEEIVLAKGQPKFHAQTIFSFIHKGGVSDIDRLTTLSKAFRKQLRQEGFYISELKTVEVFEDKDGTKKYLFELSDGKRIEAVELDDEGRKTVCISTQVGCRWGCQFCATGRLKFTRNLTAGEIADQVIQVGKACGSRISNIVYMGMGEPMDNYDAVIKSVRLLNEPNGLNIGARHITISTAGIIEGTEKLSNEGMQVRLAVSLHAAQDAARGKIMLINKKYPIADVLASVRDYQKKTKRRVTFEYMMIKDINDKPADARALLKRIEGIKAIVNLIEFNPHSGCDFVPSLRSRIREFRHILDAGGVETAIRFRRGQNIKAACGQLGAGELKKIETY